MSVMVTGAAGYLGSYVVDELLDQDRRVVGVDNLAWGRREHVDRLSDHPNFEFALVDITDTEELVRTITDNQVSEIFHLAALHFIPTCVANPTLAVRINVLGTQSVLDAAKEGAVERLAFTSTGDVYAPSDEAHREDEAPGPFNIYGLSKLQGEQLIELASQSSDTTFLVARVFNLYGARETNPHILPEIIDQLKTGSGVLRLGNLEPRRDMVPVAEAGRALVEGLAAAREPVTTVNLATGTAHRMGDLVDILVRRSGTGATVETDPAKVRASERMLLQADVSRLKDLIGWGLSPDLEQGIVKLLADEGLAS